MNHRAQSTDEEVSLHVKVPKRLKEELDAEPDSNKEFTIRQLERGLSLGSGDAEKVQAELSNARAELNRVKSEKERLAQQESKLETEIEQLEARLEDLQERVPVEDRIDDLAEFMRERGTVVDETFPKVVDIAQEYNLARVEVLERLSSRSDGNLDDQIEFNGGDAGDER